MNHLDHYGWNAHFASLVDAEDGETLDQIGRVVQEHREAYLVGAPGGLIWAEISGKMRHEGAVRSDFPAVGDWVVLRGHKVRNAGAAPAEEPAGRATGTAGPVQIVRILPRRTVLARRLEAGHEQVLAVNVDIAFLGTALNENFSVRRLERYLTLALEAGARPVILLTKADLCEDLRPYLEEIAVMAAQRRADHEKSHENGASAVGVHAISVVTGQGMEEVRALLKPGVTAVILGSSGIGKSTLVNYLVDADIQDMMEAREFDDKGRHCTTFRHLIRTKTGGLIIDTPGLRGLMLGEATEALAATFADIETLAATCRFTDCQHDTEPGCAIKSALDAGTLDPERLEGYLRLQREVAALARREHRIEERKQKKLEKRQSAQFDKKQKQKWTDRYRR